MKNIFKNTWVGVISWYKEFNKKAEQQQNTEYYKNLFIRSRKKFTLEVDDNNNIWICFDGEYVENVTNMITKQICEKINLYRKNWIDSNFQKYIKNENVRTKM